MIFLKYLILNSFILSAFVLNSYAQKDTNYYSNENELTIEGWQRQMDDYMAMRDLLTFKLDSIGKNIDSLKIAKNNYDSIYRNLQSEIYALVDADSLRVIEFNDRFEATESKILNESTSLSDIKEYWFNWISNNKIRLLKQFRTRYAVMKEKIDNWKGK